MRARWISLSGRSLGVLIEKGRRFDARDDKVQAYGQGFLDGQRDVVLIYPRTAVFDHPLPVFEFPKSEGLRLWVLPFRLRGDWLSRATRRLPRH